MDPTVFPLVNATSLAEFHGKSLKRLNLLRILTSKDMLDAVCKRCECLEQLCLDFGQELVSFLTLFGYPEWSAYFNEPEISY